MRIIKSCCCWCYNYCYYLRCFVTTVIWKKYDIPDNGNDDDKTNNNNGIRVMINSRKKTEDKIEVMIMMKVIMMKNNQ